MEVEKLHKRRLMSKYDSVKGGCEVYVWLRGPPERSYVLSRYLIARMLTVAKIPYTKAVKIALRLKKQLVDRGQLNITQDEMEISLLELMQSKRFGTVYFERMKLVHRFFCEKRPLIVSICGVPSIGKSSFTQQLASRFNLSNVLQTDLIYEMLKTMPGSPFPEPGIFEKSSLHGRAFLQEYERECLLVRRALDDEIRKTITEGKTVIMEGVHLDPALYLNDMMQLGAVAHPYEAPIVQARAKKDETEEEDSEFDDPPRPLFVSIVVTCSAEDHRLFSREAIDRRGSRFFQPQSTIEGEVLFEKLRFLNDYLIEYRHPKIMSVDIGLAGISQTLDLLHDHFLQCISQALNR